MDISGKIKALRESKKIKQRDIAASLNIDQSNYSRFEQRGDKLTIEQLQSICSALGITLEDFFNDSLNGSPVKESKDVLLKTIEEKNKLIDALQDSLMNTLYESISVDTYNAVISCLNIIDSDKLTPTQIGKLEKNLYKIIDLLTKRNDENVKQWMALLKEREKNKKPVKKPTRSTK